MTARDAQLIKRILQYCSEIEQTVDYFGADEKRFLSDFIMRNAISMPLQQIGELATHMTDAFLAEHGEIPWKQIKGMRTWFAHQYWNLNYATVWATAMEDIPALKAQCEKLLADESIEE